jgi:hypothetical protein
MGFFAKNMEKEKISEEETILCKNRKMISEGWTT